MASSRHHRRALAVHIGRYFVPLSPLCKAGSFKSRRSRSAHGSRCHSLARRTPASLSSRRPHRMFLPLSPSCRKVVQVETLSLCADGARCPSLASDRRRRCVLAVHIGRLYRSRHRAGRSFKSRRALCAHGSRCPSLASGRRRCALAVHIGRLYRTRHRARRSFKSRRARCALMVLDALLWRRTAAIAELSPST